MLGTRVLTGLSLAAIALAVLFADEWFHPWYPLWFLISLLAMGAGAIELTSLLRQTSIGPPLNSVLGAMAAITVANWLPHLGETLWAPAVTSPGTVGYDPSSPLSVLAWPFLTIVAAIMISFLMQAMRFETPGPSTLELAGVIFVIAYMGCLGTFLIQMRWLEGPYHGVPPLLLFIATAKCADVGAYTVGRLVGRHKLCPRLSPNKTIEGAIGGMVFAVGVAFLMDFLIRRFLGVVTMGPLELLGFGLVVGVAGQLGDLMESMIKRDCEQKDASSAIPGFGGVLDVLDSLLFAAPIGYLYWLAFVG